MLYTTAVWAWSRYGRGRVSNHAVLFVLLKTYGQSFVRGEITHSSRARDTARLFYRYAYMARRRVYQPANRGKKKDGDEVKRKGDREWGWGGGGERGAKGAKERAGTTLSRD